ncbi:MAG: RdgB/HAM1 family non-canonical purine NTP pyrophosphatase [Lachnospiraceae bacterium]|jgi:XTP/dITP diphosphohydrolase|nr:RdgB/HAM1 family non-canonical purine NTP pyrophosphatase [Lachnospiraceae bacterium]
MEKIIFATGNQDKMREIREIMSDVAAGILSMKEAGVEADIVEDGSTFEENALIKASAVAGNLQGKGVVVLADDSGLEVDALGGEPGIYSARYMGEDTPYEAKNREILRRLEGVPKEGRSARFVCAIAAVFPDGQSCVARETIEGYIGWEPAGENGFGYDPIFYVDEYGCSTAQLLPEVKNRLSHRGKALRAMREILMQKGEGYENINCK